MKAALKHVLLTALAVGLGVGAAHAGKAGVLAAGLVALGLLVVGATKIAGHDPRSGIQLMSYAVLFQFSVGFTAFGVLREDGGGVQSAAELQRNAALAVPALLLVGTMFVALYLGLRNKGGFVQDPDRAFDRLRELGREALLAERAGEPARAEELWARADQYCRHCGLGSIGRSALRSLVDSAPD